MARVFLAVVAAGLLLGGCSGQKRSAFQDSLDQDGLRLPNVIFMRDLMLAAEQNSVVHLDRYLAGHGMVIHGQGDGRFVYGSDLLRVCGVDCSADHGLGLLLTGFTERRERR